MRHEGEMCQTRAPLRLYLKRTYVKKIIRYVCVRFVNTVYCCKKGEYSDRCLKRGDGNCRQM